MVGAWKIGGINEWAPGKRAPVSHSPCKSERNSGQVVGNYRPSSVPGTGGHTQKGSIADHFNRVPTEEWARIRGHQRMAMHPKIGSCEHPHLKEQKRELCYWSQVRAGAVEEGPPIRAVATEESSHCLRHGRHRGSRGKEISQRISPPNRQPPASSSLRLDPVVSQGARTGAMESRGTASQGQSRTEQG